MALISKIATLALLGITLSSFMQAQNTSQSDSPRTKATDKAADSPQPPEVQPPQSAPAVTPCSASPPDQASNPCTPVAAKNHKTTSKSVTQTKSAAQSKPAQPKPSAQPATDASKRVVRNGGTSEPLIELAPETSEEEAAQQSHITIQLLASTDENLKKTFGRSLSAEQQDTLKQVKNYMDQSRTAVHDGDLQRAYNLAVKANLLSADLINH